MREELPGGRPMLGLGRQETRHHAQHLVGRPAAAPYVVVQELLRLRKLLAGKAADWVQ